MDIFNRSNKRKKDEMLKAAFSKMKEDVLYLHQEFILLRQDVEDLEQETKRLNTPISQFLSQFKQVLHSNKHPTNVQHINKTPAHDLPKQALNPQNFHVSIGNKGVPTDSQQTVNRQSNTLNRTSQPNYLISNKLNIPELSNMVSGLKQDLQEKFKKLTQQEFFVFSILYTLEEELKQVTYRDIAQRANLAESSVRDYISRLEAKGIPIVKERINNKIVLLKISPELRNLDTLESLSRLIRF